MHCCMPLGILQHHISWMQGCKNGKLGAIRHREHLSQKWQPARAASQDHWIKNGQCALPVRAVLGARALMLCLVHNYST